MERIDDAVYTNVIGNWSMNVKLVARRKGSKKAMQIVPFLLLAQLRQSQYSPYLAHSDSSFPNPSCHGFLPQVQSIFPQ